MEDRRSIAKKAAIGVALVIAAAGAVLFYKNNIAMNPGDTLLKYMSYAEDGKYEKMYDLLNEESQKSISKEEFITRLNLKITGCFIDGKKYGWINFFSLMNDYTLLFTLDKFVEKSIKNGFRACKICKPDKFLGI